MLKKIIKREILSRERKEEIKYGVIGAEIRERRLYLSRTLSSLVKDVCSVSYLCKIEKNHIRPNRKVLNELCNRVELDDKAASSLLDIKELLKKAVCAFGIDDVASLEILSDEVKVFNNYRSKLIMYIYCICNKMLEKANLIDKDLLNIVGGMGHEDLKIYFCFHAVLSFYNQEFKEASLDLDQILSSYELSDELKLIAYTYKLYSDLKLNSFRIISSYEKFKKFCVDLGLYDLLDKGNYVLAFYYLQNEEYVEYGKVYKAIKNNSYKYTLLLIVKMIFNSKQKIKKEWIRLSRPIGVFVVNYFKNKKTFYERIQNLTDQNFDYDFNPMIMEYLSLEDELERYNYIHDVVIRAIKASSDGSAIRFFMKQYSYLCCRNTRYKSFYEFYIKVKDLM